VHTIDIHQQQSFDIPLPWRPVNLASGWNMIELRNADGSAVPTWLHYDVITGTLQGTPPANFRGDLQIEIVMTDRHGAHVLGKVELHFTSGKTLADSALPAKHSTAKASLDAQFARHASKTAQALHGTHHIPSISTSTSASIASLSSRV